MLTTKPCLACGHDIKGRSDKKFCSDQCRNLHHNEQNSIQLKYLRQVNNILKRNRKVLELLNHTGKVKIHKADLVANGFNFNYFTNTYKTAKGSVYIFCYDQGYLPIDQDHYMLVVKKEFVR